MIWGAAILLDYPSLLLIAFIHSWLWILFYWSYLHKLKLPNHIKILSSLGFITLLFLISGLWFRYIGDGLVVDLEYFWYLK